MKEFCRTLGLLFTSRFKCSALRRAVGPGVRPECDLLIRLFFINIKVRILNFSDFNLKVLSYEENSNFQRYNTLFSYS